MAEVGASTSAGAGGFGGVSAGGSPKPDAAKDGVGGGMDSGEGEGAGEGAGGAAGGAARQEPGLRLFFALWPDSATSAALHARARTLQAECGGRAMRRDTIHLTLAFLGDTPAREVERLQALAAQLEGERFALVLDHVGSWKRNRVLWTGPSILPPALAALAQDLEARLRVAGFALEERAFSPHVTLVRTARVAPAAAPQTPLRWRVASFVLVASERSAAGAHYRVIGRWPLQQRG